jgi:AraC family transcriptional regulator of adaptative response/methylated-DNA-[protein]-cysteine methyltransferase
MALKTIQIKTPLGPMVAVADEKALHFLGFVDGRGVERELEALRKRQKSELDAGHNPVLKSIESELSQYFDGKLSSFKTPLSLDGTEFQESVWRYLRRIPHGKTKSYADVALGIGKPTAFRAVANANGRNQIAIVIPCHRVINANGDLGGYGGRVERKQWLLDHEKTGQI